MNATTNGPTSHTQAAFYAAPFDVLDSCHQEILGMADDLRRLLDHVDAVGVDHQARELARGIHLFFSTTGLQHHLDEENHVFPKLRANGEQEMLDTIEHLHQDHLQIEAQWRALVPYLDMIARGYRRLNLAEVRCAVNRFSALCQSHIALEESLIYPEAKSNMNRQELWIMRREMAARRSKLNAQSPEPDMGGEDGDM